jgi:transcriptional regulator with XRE-family HTH domain
MKESTSPAYLVAKRREKGVTQDDLAEYIGVSKGVVSKWETRTKLPDNTFLRGWPPISTSDIDADGFARRWKKATSGSFTPVSGVILRQSRLKTGAGRSGGSSSGNLLVLSAAVADGDAADQLITSRGRPAGARGHLRWRRTVPKRCARKARTYRSRREAVSMEAACHLMLGQPSGVFDLLGEEVHLLSSDGALIAQAYQMRGDRRKRRREATQYRHLSERGDAGERDGSVSHALRGRRETDGGDPPARLVLARRII